LIRVDGSIARLVNADVNLVRVEELALVLSRIRVIATDKDRRGSR